MRRIRRRRSDQLSYDAVLVLRTQKAVDAFCNPKVSLGADIAVVAGPVGSGVCVMSSFGSPDHQRPRSGSSEPCVQLRQEQGHLRWCSAHWQHCDRAPGACATKCGSPSSIRRLPLLDTLFRAALTLKDENATFYGRKISAKEILRGGSVAVPEAVGVLHTVIAAAEGSVCDEDLQALTDADAHSRPRTCRMTSTLPRPTSAAARRRSSSSMRLSRPRSRPSPRARSRPRPPYRDRRARCPIQITSRSRSARGHRR